MKPKPVSKKLLMRLPLYLDYLKALPEDTVNVSATAISKALGLGEVQVRIDLSEASPAGRSRTGRSREKLIQDIINYLDFETSTSSVVIGAGKLGQALMDFNGFAEFGLNIVAGFDLLPLISDHTEGGTPIYSMSKLEAFCRTYDIKIGILTVPEKAAQRACDALVACGIRAIWNFTPVYLTVPSYVLVESVDLASSLFILRDRLRQELVKQT